MTGTIQAPGRNPMPHRLIGSSVPGELEAAHAKALLYERLVLSSAVCRHLVQSSSYLDPMPTTALTLLLRWVAAHYEPHVETTPATDSRPWWSQPDPEP